MRPGLLWDSLATPRSRPPDEFDIGERRYEQSLGGGRCMCAEDWLLSLDSNQEPSG
jgi:hypothetical protein